jgi:DNA polymerase I-like protein with 3'-5' exonuclease and polymerase domains
MKLALVRIDAMLPEECHLLLTVHDEVLVSAPDHLVDKATQVVYDGMTGKGIQKWLKTPLGVDLHVGQRWSEIK